MVYPSLYEGFGLPIAKQWLQVVSYTSNISSMPEVGQAACVYYDPLKGDSLADNLWLLLIMSNLRSIAILGLNHSKEFT